MTKLKRYYYFGWFALLSTLTFHLLTYLPYLRTSHGGLIFIFTIATFPPLITATKAGEHYLRKPDSPVESTWSDFLRYTPKWLKSFFWIVIPYVAFNFIFSLWFLNEGGLTPEITDAKYVLESKGKIVKEITENQYFKHKAYLFRSISGHAILFNLLSVSILASVFKSKENQES